MKVQVPGLLVASSFFVLIFKSNFQQLVFYADSFVSIFARVWTPHDYEGTVWRMTLL